MSLPHFIHESLDDILSEWERECAAAAAGPEPRARRVHFGKVLHAVAEEMKRIKAVEPAAGAAASDAVRAPRAEAPAAPHSHASQLVDDYASLRASVVRQWRRKHPSPSGADVDDLVRFNEAMDRSLAELTATFSSSPAQPQPLFLGVLNHELRTSVASILMSAQLLTHRSAPGSADAKAAQRILRSCEQLRQTLDALSDCTKVRLGDHLQVDRVEDDMGVLCKQALDAFARVDPERRVRLTSDGDLSGDWDTARIGEAIAEKPIGPMRIYLSIAVTGLSIMVALVTLYAGIRNAIIAIGRNPLSKKSIFRGLAEIILTSFLILIIGLFTVYLLLKL